MPTYQSPQPQAEIRPTKSGIWIGIVLMVVAFVAFVALMVVGIRGVFDALNKYEQVEPGSVETIELDSGDYLIFVDETLYTDATVVGTSGPVQLTSERGNVTYESDGTTWSSAYSFSVSQAGSYEVTNSGTAFITVGPPFAGKLVTAILLPLLVGFVLGVGGLVLLVSTLVRRRKARRRLAQPQMMMP